MPLNEGYEPTEVIGVTRQHLQEILAALSWAHHYFEAQELAEAYKEGRQTPKPSKITTTIARAYNHAEGYIYDGTKELTGQQPIQ
jgi:hypothetical protein